LSEGLLTVLKFCFLALVYLFLLRVVQVVVREMRAGKLTVPQPVPVAAPVPEVVPAAGGSTRRKAKAVATLHILEPPAHAGETYPVSGELTVGRAAGCAIVVPDDTYVSQVHARVYEQQGDAWVEDLGSTNGTFVNGERLAGPVRLRKGDRVQFGGTVAEVGR
jgi:predicted component of type VI protein secretion system